MSVQSFFNIILNQSNHYNRDKAQVFVIENYMRIMRTVHTTEHCVQYTQQNTTITTHKRSQLLISTETRYQLQQSHKELHTEHRTLSTINLH